MKDLQLIKEEEARIGRPLSVNERLSLIQKPSGNNDDDMVFILTQTTEGVEAKKAFDAKIAELAIVKGVSDRHKAALTFESTKRDLLARFRANKLHKIA